MKFLLIYRNHEIIRNGQLLKSLLQQPKAALHSCSQLDNFAFVESLVLRGKKVKIVFYYKFKKIPGQQKNSRLFPGFTGPAATLDIPVLSEIVR